MKIIATLCALALVACGYLAGMARYKRKAAADAEAVPVDESTIAPQAGGGSGKIIRK